MRRTTVGIVASTLALALAGSAFAQGKPRVAFIPQIVGIPYFNAMEAGGNKAAEKLGVQFIYQGPVDTDPVDQLQILSNLIDQGVEAIAISVLDASSFDPVIEQAKDKGSIIFTSDSDAPNSQRAVYVAQASDQGLGYTIIDELVKRVGENAKIGIVSGEPTATNLNTWIGFMKERVAAKYPNVTLLEPKFAGGTAQRAAQLATDLMTANPDLKGIIAVASTTCPGVAQAIEFGRQDRSGGGHRLLQPEHRPRLSEERRVRLHRALGPGRARLPHGLGRPAADRGQGLHGREPGSRHRSTDLVRSQDQDPAAGSAGSVYRRQRRPVQLLRVRVTTMAIAPAIRRPGTREAALLAACVLTAAVFATASPYFLTAGNLATIARNSVELLMIALGMTLVIATGGIDISVGAAMGVCAIAVGTALDAGWPAAAAAALGPVGGMALGLITAAIVVRGGVPPIIATLGLFGIWRAAVYLLLRGRWISGLPDDLGLLVRSSILGVPTVAFEILALYLLAWLVLRRTPLGTWWLAIGGNETAARLSGVQVVLAKSAVYAASGFCVGLAATVYVAQYRNVEMTIGGTVALDAIVAAVLGGAAVAGGRASLAGTALGVVLVRILQNGFVLVGVPSLWEQVVIGALLLGVLALERVSILRLGARPA